MLYRTRIANKICYTKHCRRYLPFAEFQSEINHITDNIASLQKISDEFALQRRHFALHSAEKEASARQIKPELEIARSEREILL